MEPKISTLPHDTRLSNVLLLIFHLMKKPLIYLLIPACIALWLPVHSQQVIPIAADAPVTTGGLKLGFNLTKSQEAQGKGNNNKYNTEFYVTNITSEAKIILYKQNFEIAGGDVSPNLVQFDCVNATGADRTSKGTTVQAKPCTVTALVDDRDCNAAQSKKNKREVTIGYWIKPGETLSSSVTIMLPANAKPDVKATILLDEGVASNAILGSSVSNTSHLISQGYLRIKNVSASTYLNMQTGPVTCTAIQEDWFNSQWEILPVDGTNYYVIRNRVKNVYINTENMETLNSPTAESVNSLWVLEPAEGNNVFMLKNVGNIGYLVVQAGKLQLAPVTDKPAYAKWVIER
jgi:hypothetical protein